MEVELPHDVKAMGFRRVALFVLDWSERLVQPAVHNWDSNLQRGNVSAVKNSQSLRLTEQLVQWFRMYSVRVNLVVTPVEHQLGCPNVRGKVHRVNLGYKPTFPQTTTYQDYRAIAALDGREDESFFCRARAYSEVCDFAGVNVVPGF